MHVPTWTKMDVDIIFHKIQTATQIDQLMMIWIPFRFICYTVFSEQQLNGTDLLSPLLHLARFTLPKDCSDLLTQVIVDARLHASGVFRREGLLGPLLCLRGRSGLEDIATLPEFHRLPRLPCCLIFSFLLLHFFQLQNFFHFSFKSPHQSEASY